MWIDFLHICFSCSVIYYSFSLVRKWFFFLTSVAVRGHYSAFCFYRSQCLTLVLVTQMQKNIVKLEKGNCVSLYIIQVFWFRLLFPDIVVSPYLRRNCSKTPSESLRVQIVPNPYIYFKVFPIYICICDKV